MIPPAAPPRRAADGAPRTRLIINADDFGLAPGVTEGIAEACTFGTVTSTSMMVGCPGFDRAAALLPSLPGLGIGLHFNLLTGTPLTAGATIADARTGRYHSLRQLASRALTARLDPAEIEAECEAQLGAIRALGIVPTHMDSHRHTHALPTIRGAVARVALRHDLPLRRPVESLSRPPLEPASVAHRAAVACAWYATSATAPGTRATRHFAGISLQGGVGFAELLTALLTSPPAGTLEIMVHPGRTDDELSAVDGYTWQRECELAALLSPRLRDLLRGGGISPIHFGQL